MQLRRTIARRWWSIGDVGSGVRGDVGIIDARDGWRAPRTVAQLTNRFPPATWLYESCWRAGAMTRFSGRSFPLAEELDELARAAAVGPGDLVVDLACSEGLYGRHLAGRGAEVFLVDHSTAFLRRARRRCRRAGVAERVDLLRAGAQHLPFDAASVDAVVIGGSLNELGADTAAIAAALAEVARVLRPGGRLFSMSLVAAGAGRARLVQRILVPLGFTFPDADETVALLGDGAFEVTERRIDGLVLRLTAVRTER